MNILNKIKKNWNFNKTVEENVIYFNTIKEQESKAKKRNILISLLILGLAILTHNPLAALGIFICAITYGTSYNFSEDTGAVFGSEPKITALDSTHFAITYYSGSLSASVVTIGTVSGDTISYGSEYSIGSIANCRAITTIDATHFMVIYINGSSALKGKIGTVSSGNVIAFGSEYSIVASVGNYYLDITTLDSTHVAISYITYTNNYISTIIGTISEGTVIAVGSEYNINAVASTENAIVAIDSTHFAVFYKDNVGGKVIIGTVSGGNTVSYGSAYTVGSGAITDLDISLLDSTHLALAWCATSGYGSAAIGTISSVNVVTLGSTYIFKTVTVSEKISITTLSATKIAISYRNWASPYYGAAVVGTVSGDVITFGTPVNFNAVQTYWTQIVTLTSTKVAVLSTTDVSGSHYGQVIIGTDSSPAPGMIMMFE